MDEKPQSFWKKVFTSRITFLIGLPFAAFLVSLVRAIFFGQPPWRHDWDIVIVGTIGGTTVALLILFFRWLFSIGWRRALLRLAGFAGLITLFYAEEDWRGWHAWSQFKHEWEAKGEKFDFKDFIPPPVPDDQNFAMAPIFDATDKWNNWEWQQQHRNPRYHEKFGLSSYNGEGPWDTNLVDRLAMNIYPQYDSGNTNLTFGLWQKAQLSDLRPWQESYRHPKAESDMSSVINPITGLPIETKSPEPSAVVTNEFPVAPQPQTPVADVLLALSKFDSAIEELRQASLRPYARFPLAYDQDFKAEISLAHLASLKKCSQVLLLRSLAELQNGQPGTALADVKLSLCLVNSIRTEPFLISHLVRIAMLQITLQPIYEGWAERRWSDDQLVALDAELAKLDFLADYKFTMRGEMGCESGMFDWYRKKPEYLAMFFDGPLCLHDDGPSFSAKLVCRAIPNGWLYQNQLNCARFMVNFNIPLADPTRRTFSVNRCQEGDNDLQASRTPASIFNYMKLMMTPALGACARKFAHTQASVDLARTAIALERCRLAHGEFPESLDALAPQFIAQVPHDVIGGQPLKYRRTSDGQFVLYSVGWNEKDDDGVVGLTANGQAVDNNKGDWVWRYPAK